MKKKLLVTASMAAASVGLVAPDAGAYTRGAAPVILTATCSPITDTVYVQWDKNEGKPSVIGVFSSSAGPSSPIAVLSIPRSRASKGFWNFAVGVDLDGAETYSVALASGSGGASLYATCYPT